MKRALLILMLLLLCLALGACARKSTGQEANVTVSPEAEKPAEQTVITTETASPEPTSEPEPTTEPTQEPVEESQDIRPEIKDFLDAYETFMDKYVEFMGNYAKADMNDLMNMISQYTEIMNEYALYAEKVEQIDQSELNAAELAYYLEVTNRVNQKLLHSIG